MRLITPDEVSLEQAIKLAETVKDWVLWGKFSCPRFKLQRTMESYLDADGNKKWDDVPFVYEEPFFYSGYVGTTNLTTSGDDVPLTIKIGRYSKKVLHLQKPNVNHQLICELPDRQILFQGIYSSLLHRTQEGFYKLEKLFNSIGENKKDYLDRAVKALKEL